jgi:hypothetical protein
MPEPAARPADAQALRHIHPRLHTARTLVRDAPPPASLRASSIPPLDALLGGGLRKGYLVEVVGRRSCGRFSTVLQTLSAFTRRGEVAALVDLGDALDPRTAIECGIDPSRLLWVRPRHLKPALVAAELLLQTGFPLVVLDLGLPPIPGGRGAEASWIRLLRAARKQHGILLVSSPYRASGTTAQAVVEARRAAAEWRGRGDSPKLLAALSTHLRLAKAIGRGPAAPRPLRWSSGAMAG